MFDNVAKYSEANSKDSHGNIRVDYSEYFDIDKCKEIWLKMIASPILYQDYLVGVTRYMIKVSSNNSSSKMSRFIKTRMD